jgi:hypothetical protein
MTPLTSNNTQVSFTYDKEYGLVVVFTAVRQVEQLILREQ